MSNELLNHAEHDKDYLRSKRAKAFKAFDIYKSNVEYGIISETAETKAKIIKWYNACLNLEFEAINNVPSEIKRYYTIIK